MDLDRQVSRRKKHIRSLLAGILAGIVVFTTTYSLVLPAITLSEDVAAGEPGFVMEEPTEAAGEMPAMAFRAVMNTGQETVEGEILTPERIAARTQEEEARRSAASPSEGQPLVVDVEAKEAAFPKGTRMTVVSDADPEAAAAMLRAAENETDGTFALAALLGITFRDADGTEIVPRLPIRVSVYGLDLPEDGAIVVALDDEGETAIVEQPLDIETAVDEVVFDIDAEESRRYGLIYRVATPAPEEPAEEPAIGEESAEETAETAPEEALSEEAVPAQEETPEEVAPAGEEEAEEVAPTAEETPKEAVIDETAPEEPALEEEAEAAPVTGEAPEEAAAEEVPAEEGLPTEEELPADEELPAEEEAPVEEELPAEEEASVDEKVPAAPSMLCAEGPSYLVTVTGNPEAEIPDGAELVVAEIAATEPAYADYAEQAAALLGAEKEITFARFFAISIEKDGEEIQPQDPVEVQIRLPEKLTGEIRAIHFGEEEEILRVRTGEMTAEEALPEGEEAEEETQEVPRAGKRAAGRNSGKAAADEAAELPDGTTDAEDKAEDPADGIPVPAEQEAGFDVGSIVSFTAEGFSVYGIVTTAPGDLDGKTYGILNNQNTVSGKAVMNVPQDNNTKLQAKQLTVRTEPVGRTGIVFVAQNSDITMWSFHDAEDGRYYLTTTVGNELKYLRISTAGVSLVAPEEVDEDCRILVEAGTGRYAGKYRFSGSSRALSVSGNSFTTVGKSTSNANVWMNLTELSDLQEDDFVTYTATKVSVSDPVNVPDGAQVVVYTRVWNEETLKYEYYTLDYDGMLVRAYESGNNISWVGSKINTMLWNFTEHHYDDGTPNYYYELQNAYSGKYIAPQVGGTEFLADAEVGINLNGRRYDNYYTSILAWDDDAYDYATLRVKNGKLVPASIRKAADFYFAIMNPEEEEEELQTVATIDHKPFGITVKMQDYGNINSSNRSQDQVDVLGNTPYVQWTGSPGLLEKNLVDGYPQVANSSHSLSELYNDTMEANQLFLASTFKETGYFEYDCTQNFAHLISAADDPWVGQPRPGGGTYEVGDFVLYSQLGTSTESGKDTLKHGQFLPYNDLKEGVYSSYINEMDIHAQPLSSLDPRKGEKLYAINYKKGQTAPNYVDHFFGMEMSASFIQNEGGLDAWGRDLIFEFSGDDDFWFYVDDMLVLDLGGIHSALDSSINFRTGKVVVNGRVTNLRALYREAYLEKNPGTDEATVNAWLNTIFKDDGSNTGTVFQNYTGHTMRMFYMERGAGASNLHMRFNLAPYTAGEVQLEKEVSGTENIQYTDVRFPFQLMYHQETWPANRYEPWPEAEKVTDLATGEPVDYAETYELGGRTYEHVYFLKPGQTISARLPAEDTKYYVQECGVDASLYDAVYADRGETPLEPTTATATATYRDYRNESTTVVNRKKTIFTNHVAEDTLKNLRIVKKVWADREKTIPVEDDETPFRFRIYIGRRDGEPSVYSFGEYHVLDPAGEYCIYENGRFVSTGKTVYGDLDPEAPDEDTKSEREKANFYTSQGGAADKIPPGYTVEIPGLVDGTPYLVEERTDEIPAGYERLDYELVYTDPESGEERIVSGNAGTISADQSNPLVVVNNRHGYSLAVEKVWSDQAFMKSHDPIYCAVYRQDGAGNLLLVPDSVRQLAHPATTMDWFLDELEPGATLNDYRVYEVDLLPEDAEITVDEETGIVSGFTDVARIEEGGTLTVCGEGNEHGYSMDYVYTASYERTFLTEEELAAAAHAREDRVRNARPGIRLVKTDLNGTALAGAVFSLREDREGAESQTFVSNETGLIAVAYLEPDHEYILTEEAAPARYRALIAPLVLRVTVSEEGRYSLWVNDEQTGDDAGTYDVTQVANPTVDEMPQVTVRNKPFTLEAVKVDAETGNPLAGVPFAIYRQLQDSHTGAPIPDYTPLAGFENLVTDEEGRIPGLNAEQLRPGSYYLREKEAPTGYKPLGGDVRFTITPKGTLRIESAPTGAAEALEAEDNGTARYTLRVKNVPNKALQVLKKNMETKDPLAGAEFALYLVSQIENGKPKDGEEPLASGISGDDGILRLGALEENITYYLFETKAPEGYAGLTAPVVLTVTAGAVTAKVEGAPQEIRNIGSAEREIWQLTVYNTAGYELPHTGGPGTAGYTVGGMLLLALAGALLRKKNGAAPGKKSGLHN